MNPRMEKTGAIGITEDSSSTSSKQYGAAHPPASQRRSILRLAVAALTVFVVVALALGLGLGLGLKKSTGPGSSSGANNEQPDSGATDEQSLASFNVQSWRKSTEDYRLDLKGWDFNAKPTTRSYDFVLSEIFAAPDGVNRTVLAINGQTPGPLIRLNRGDRLLVNVTNNMSNATSMHWHGMFQNGTNWMDGSNGITQCAIQPGHSFLYNFTIDNQYGTYWYHSHLSTTYVDGLVGPLIVHAPEEVQQQQLYDQDQVVLVQDWYHDLSRALLPGFLGSGNENAEPVPDNGVINGANYFNCSSLDPSSGYDCANTSSRPTFAVEQGQRYRLRFVNTGAFTTFDVSIDNHTLQIIEADGTPTTPLHANRFSIATAQRYSVILNANQSASTNYWLRTTMIDDCFAGPNPLLDESVRALITYTNSTAAPTSSIEHMDPPPANECLDFNNTLLTPLVAATPPIADAIYQISFSFHIGDNAMDRALVNGTSWTPSIGSSTLDQAIQSLQNTTINTSSTGQIVSNDFTPADQFVIGMPSSQNVVDIFVQNFDDGAHPFHLHGHQFWVLQITDQTYLDWTQYNSKFNTADGLRGMNPIRRDTITIPAYGYALLRFTNDNAGMWPFHCHNIWHMEAGLMVQFLNRAEQVKGWTLPADVQALCKA